MVFSPFQRAATVLPMKRLTEKSLRNQALFYLSRYAASRQRVERLLTRRLAKAETEERSDIDATAIPSLLDDLERLGLLNDETFAMTKARSLARRGLSEAAIARRLAVEGLDRGTVEAALTGLEGALSDEVSRAWIYCRKRGLGPYRAPELRDQRRNADLAALARRGFSYETARQVIDADAVPEEIAAEAR